jgi:Abnormal spindle-like microcephaly-assoc'd, ASPM-SPD-2-Hydin
MSLPAAWMAVLLLAIVHLAGCGVTYNTLPLAVNPSSVSFGTVQVGQTQSQAITLQNQGLNSVTLSGMQVADPAFVLSPAQMTMTIPAGGTASLQVSFKPTAVKSYSSQVVVSSGGQNTNISVSGTGQQTTTTTPPPSASPALTVSATTLQFGSVPIGGDAQQSLTMTSTGTAPLQISSLSAQGGAFSAQSPALPLTLQPGQALTLPVKFGPKTSGGENGQLVIASNAAATPSVTVDLIGNGAAPTPPPPTAGTPALTLSSTAVNFGSVAVGSQGSNSVTLTSSGTAAVVLQSVAVSGTGFSVGQVHLPLTLAVGQQITLPLSFAPASAGAQQGQVTLTGNATGSPDTINLTGTGTTTASLSVPTSLDFGDVTVGSEGDKTITLVSNGTGPVTVSSITVAGASFSDSIQALPQVLQPNQQMSVKLKFDPKAEGNATGTVTVSSNSASNPSSVVQIRGNGVVASSPSLSASASSLSFGQVPLGSTATKTVTVTSTGTAPATITGGTVTGAGYRATYAGVPVENLSAPITLQPGQVVTFSVAFDPTAAAASNGQLSLATDTGSPVNVSLTGTGVQNTSPALTASAPSLNFGDVQMGSKATLQLTLTSSGTAPVTISSSTIAGQAFGISSVAYPAGITGWPATLNPGQQVVLSIAFAPDSATSFTGDLAVASNASGGTADVPLSGTGDAVPAPNLTLSTTSIDFGQSVIGTKVSRTLTLTSTGNAPLNINTIMVSGAMFSVGTVSLPATLQPGQQLQVTVTFDPTTAGTDSGTLTVTSDDPSGPATVSLGGTGTATTTPQLTVSPTVVNFGNVPLNAASTQPVTLTSTGSAAVTINAATVTGPGFSVTGANFPLTLNPNQSVTLQVQFDPTAAGAASGQMTVTSNSTTGGTTQVTLNGTGTVAAAPQLTVSAGSLSFGNVTVNSTGTLPVTLTSSGTAPLTITAATVSGADFTDSGATFPVTLNPNTSVTLQVHFAPTAAGAVTGQLTITSNAATGGTTHVQLSGTGTAAATAQLQVSATSLPFGSVPVNSTATLTLTLISSGTAPVTINSVALTGTGFSDSGATFPVTLNANQSVTLNVQFDPTVAAAATGQLTITSNSSTGGTTQVALSGTGTAAQHEIDLSWDAPSSSADPVAGYNVYRSTDGGGSFTKVNASPDDQVDYTDSAVQSGTTYVYEVKSVDASGVESGASNQISLTVP